MRKEYDERTGRVVTYDDDGDRQSESWHCRCSRCHEGTAHHFRLCDGTGGYGWCDICGELYDY